MKYFIIVFTLLSFQGLFSQALSGKVYDSKTELPLEGVSLYFDGSSIGTVTSKEGYFSIDPKFNSNAFLIVSHIGYKTENISYEELGKDLRIGLSEDLFELQEVTLVSDPFTRKQKLKVFRKEFLGETKAAKNCQIKNEDALDLYFNSNDNTLNVYAEKPLIVSNNYLGYTLRFDLRNFKINFRKKSLERKDNMESTILLGHIFFEDISEKEMKFLERRKDVYQGSIQHFIRTLWNQNWLNETFEIRNGYLKMGFLDALTVYGGSDLYTKRVLFKLKELSIKHKKGIFNYWSILKILSEHAVTIDKYGNYTPYLSLEFSGFMGSRRVGDLLPLDYEDNLIVD